MCLPARHFQFQRRSPLTLIPDPGDHPTQLIFAGLLLILVFYAAFTIKWETIQRR